MMKRTWYLLVIAACCNYVHVTHATVLAGGNAMTALGMLATSTAVSTAAQMFTFSQPVTAKAYDQQTGVLYLALDNLPNSVVPSPSSAPFPPPSPLITTAPTGQFAISKVQRATSGTNPQFVPIATNTNFFPPSTTSSVGVDFLALATAPGNPKPNLAIVTQNPNNNYLAQPSVIVSSSDGNIVQGLSNIKAFTPIYGQEGAISTGIVQLEANESFVFAAVRPPPTTLNGATIPQDFGFPGSGIAVVGLNPRTLFPAQLAAQQNDPAVKAAELDNASKQVILVGSSLTQPTFPVFVPNHVSLNWDDTLERLYVGLQIATAGPQLIDVVTTVTTCNPVACPELVSYIDGVAFETQSCLDLIAASSCLYVFVNDFGVTVTQCFPECGFESSEYNQSVCDALILSSTCLILTQVTSQKFSPRGGNEGDGTMSVVVGTVNEQGQLILNNFFPAAALPNDPILINGNQSFIVGVRQHVDKPLSLSAAHLKTMHTSTGASYLILNGGNGAITNNAYGAEGNYTISMVSTVTGTAGNQIWALPLVDVGDPNNPTQGVLANKNVFNEATHRFEVPVQTTADLTVVTDIAAQVGAGPLPVLGSTPISGAGAGTYLTESTSTPPFVTQVDIIVGVDTLDLTVVGDTVYVALANQATSTVNDTGIFYSQALFNEAGAIQQWTP